MKTPKNKENKVDLSQFDVDFNKFTINRKVIQINGKELPLAIGDKIKITENDPVAKTVMGILIHEDSRVQYVLEWHDPNTGTFQSEQITLTELKLMNQSQTSTPKKRNVVGFGQSSKKEVKKDENGSK